MIFTNNLRKKLKAIFFKEYAYTQEDLSQGFNISNKEVQKIQKNYKEKLDYIQKVRKKFHLKKKSNNFRFKNFLEFYFWYRNQPKKCSYCGTKENVLIYLYDNKVISSKRKRGRTLEIERKNSTLNEYSKDNCILSCYFCNNHKSDTISEKDYRKYFAEPMQDYLFKSYNICDKEKNHLYISDIDSLSKDLQDKYKKFYDKFTKLLNENNIKYTLLQDTKDIWCRDYMPIQINPKTFLTYSYNPDYLKAKKYLKIKTNFNDVNHTLKLKKIIKTELILDGGNIVKSKNCAILTDKIFKENPRYSKIELIQELKNKLEIEKIVIIPWDKNNEYFGHADGMVRFIDENTVLINDYFKSYPIEFKENFFTALKDNNLVYKELTFDIPNRNDKLNWGYINYLEIKDIIILPEFGIDEDSIAKEQFIEIFKNYKILSIDACKLIENGGVLNCMTWSIYQE